jgi:hypothetical protein
LDWRVLIDRLRVRRELPPARVLLATFSPVKAHTIRAPRGQRATGIIVNKRQQKFGRQLSADFARISKKPKSRAANILRDIGRQITRNVEDITRQAAQQTALAAVSNNNLNTHINMLIYRTEMVTSFIARFNDEAMPVLKAFAEQQKAKLEKKATKKTVRRKRRKW